MSVQITIEEFNEFEEVRQNGLYNMFDPKARELTNLSKEQWVVIMRDYSKLKEAWSKDNES